MSSDAFHVLRTARNSGWLTRNVWVLSAVSFLQDTASELVYPLLPIYLTAVLGVPPAVVGAVEGAAEGAASLTKLTAGPGTRPTSATDLRNRRRLLRGDPVHSLNRSWIRAKSDAAVGN